jgi:hypothetical protein
MPFFGMPNGTRDGAFHMRHSFCQLFPPSICRESERENSQPIKSILQFSTHINDSLSGFTRKGILDRLPFGMGNARYSDQALPAHRSSESFPDFISTKFDPTASNLLHDGHLSAIVKAIFILLIHLLPP